MAAANDILNLPALALAEKLRAGELSPLEAVEAFIARIEQVNPKLNAVVWKRFDEARREAREIERKFPGEKPPLYGVPCSVKEAIALTGAPHTAGSVYRKSVVPAEDAPVVRRLREAGAIPLGVTNVSEMCMWFESYNPLYGRTNNPYDQGRIPGGSSGGEGSILGAGAAPFGVGSDVGGSIRMPAFFCGIFGHKPTGGLLTTEGLAPLPQGEVRRYCSAGPMSRHAGDLPKLLEIMSGGDWKATAERLPFRGREVWVCEGVGFPAASASEEQLEALWRAADAFARAGATVRWFDPRRFGNAFVIWSSMLHEGGNPEFARIMTEGGDPNLLKETALYFTGRSQHTFPAVVLAVVERLFGKIAGDGPKKTVEEGLKVRADFEAALGDDGILLMPTHPRAAPPHDAPLRRPFDFAYTGILNVLEVPATAAPLGIGAEGVPLGVQVAARRGADRLTLEAAEFLEEQFGGWVPPKGL